MIFDKRDLKFERLGYMVDCSRGAVPKIETLKKLVDYLAEFGYTYLELYTEDTYEIDGEPYFGYMRGRYTAVEIAELDTYAKQKNIELIPCIQTLAHLERIQKYEAYKNLFEISNILTVGDDAVYALIEKMLISVGKMFSSNRVHIGMDEAWLLGRGKLLDQNGKMESVEIMRAHLEKVAEIADKLGMECEIWSDMFTSETSNAKPEDRALVPVEEMQVPDNVMLVMWWYWRQSDKVIDAFIRKNKALGKKTVFAGGAQKWMGFAPNNEYSIDTTQHQIQKCIEHGVDGFMLTAWGDGAADCSLFAVLPTIFACACFAYGKDVNAQLKTKFMQVVGTSYDSFMLLDKLNRPENKTYVTVTNQCFIYCYNDVLQGIADSLVQPDAKHIFTIVSEELRKTKCGKNFKYLFSSMKALCDFVAEKSTIGKRAYDAYIAKEIDGLKVVVKRLDNAIKLLDNFIEEYTVQWETENKSFGFEKQQVRLGGLKLRMEYTRNKIKAFCQGKIPCIEEFEVARMPIGWLGEKSTCDNVVTIDFNSLISGGSLLG